MCGIIGQIARNGQLSDLSVFENAMNAMAHRGPDARSFWTDPAGRVRFGHLRLSIQDPRPGGTQPMHLHNAGRQISLVFNGEIYNFIELRQELMALGYAFVTDTDTEVILAAYAAWGSQCAERFNGMFAIALFDAGNQTVFFWRDRTGEKPLYYHTDADGTFSFASELTALHQLIGLKKPRPRELDPVLIEHFMSFGYVPGDTPLQAATEFPVRKLLPAQRIQYRLQGTKGPEFSYYWADEPARQRVRSQHNTSSHIPDAAEIWEQQKQTTQSLIDSSLEMRLRADVPLGVFLSGGLDSSAVVSWLHDKVPGRLKTFSVRYDMNEFGLGFDESQYARQVAEAFNTEHHEYTMTPNDFVSYLPQYIQMMGEPVTEAAAISLHYLSELAKQHVTVVLSGEGSDEIFAGYELYRRMIWLERFHQAVRPAGAKAIHWIAKRFLKKGSKLGKYIALAALPFEERYRGISVNDPAYRMSAYQESFKKRIGHAAIRSHRTTQFMQRIMESTRGDNLLNRMLRFDRKTWLVDDLLIKADRMSMGSSLELRVPFLDHRLIEWSNQLPPQAKIRKNDPKFILKNLVPKLPETIVRREKLGFPTPLAQMFKGGVLRDKMLQEFSDPACPLWVFFKQSSVEAFMREHDAGVVDHHAFLWQLLVLCLWLKAHCDTEASDA